MKEKLKLFENATFLWGGREYVVRNTKIIDLKASIFTDRQTFVKYESELDSFLNEIKFIDKSVSVQSEVLVEKELQRQEVVQEIKEQGIAIVQSVHHAEIMDANNRAMRISDKLEDVFNELSSGEFDEQKYKKAEAMVKLSNAIVSNEMTRFKYLTLK
jgi:hypothetical protein